jgi:hypothetical protein
LRATIRRRDIPEHPDEISPSSRKDVDSRRPVARGGVADGSNRSHLARDLPGHARARQARRHLPTPKRGPGQHPLSDLAGPVLIIHSGRFELPAGRHQRLTCRHPTPTRPPRDQLPCQEWPCPRRRRLSRLERRCVHACEHGVLRASRLAPDGVSCEWAASPKRAGGAVIPPPGQRRHRQIREPRYESDAASIRLRRAAARPASSSGRVSLRLTGPAQSAADDPRLRLDRQRCQFLRQLRPPPRMLGDEQSNSRRVLKYELRVV